MRFPVFVLLPVFCFSTSSLTAATTFFGPLTSYSSSENVPSAFLCQECDECVHVIEDFEDSSLDHGLLIRSTDGQIIGPGFGTGLDGLTDSVDGDDGAVDGVGNEAHSYFSSGNVLTILFPSPMKSAGFVWTDGDRGTMTTVDFYGHAGLLGSLGPFALADDSFQGTTAEDTFFGAQDPNGITSIVVTNLGGSGIEIDHVQFEDCSACAATVPEPHGVLMLLFGGLGAFGFRRR